jgi:hypothetical protein
MCRTHATGEVGVHGENADILGAGSVVAGRDGDGHDGRVQEGKMSYSRIYSRWNEK